MTKRALFRVAVSIFGFLLVAAPVFAGGTEPNPERERIISNMIRGVLDRWHFHPQKFDRELSGKAFDLYLERLDPGKQFLLSSDVDELRGMAGSISEDFRTGDFRLLNTAQTRLAERMGEVRSFYDELLAEPFDFEQNEEIVTDLESLDYAGDAKRLRERWRQNLKYQVLVRYLGMVETEKVDDNVFHADLEVKAREQVKKNVARAFERIQQMDREEHLSRYLNAAINVSDPHTEYYPPLEKENFDIQITGRLEGIGAQLREEDGYIKVVDIVPGSASWRTKELEAEDIILKVAQEGEEPVDVVGASIDDVVQLVRGPKGSKVSLTVKKVDGRITTIGIVRDVVVLEETYAKGAVIDHGTYNRRFGYIDLPKFYTDFRRDGSPRASEDVARLLAEFKGAGVDGVLLDLRDNGGGSLQEAVDIAGLFIKTGPVVQVQDRFGNREVHSDEDPNIVWDGEVVVLVNSFSASASEILAAMLQDYDRAVVVGAPTTFGKGTVQRFYELDELVDDRFAHEKPLGSVKLTVQQFYRVNGASTQYNGVVPDVVLPDVYGYRDIGERSLDFTLPGDTIDPADHDLWLGRTIPTGELSAKSRNRIEQSEIFQLITDRAEHLKAEQDRKTESLNWRTMQTEQEKLQAEFEAMKAATVEFPYLHVKAVPISGDNEAHAAMMEEFSKGIAKDAYVDEGLSILNDLRTISVEYGWTVNDLVNDRIRGSE